MVMWLIVNVQVEGQSLAGYVVDGLEPIGWLLGLNGVILLAYVIAIPANEIVIPAILMLTITLGSVASGQPIVMQQLGNQQAGAVLVGLGAGRC